jgi:hypothetical protein
MLGCRPPARRAQDSLSTIHLVVSATIALGLAPGTALSGGPFDGSWNVLIVCAQAPDGAKGYRWNFLAKVRDGSFLGQYNQPGNFPSGTLSGQIQGNGDAYLKMVGLTGDPEHNVGRVPSGMPFGYFVAAHFAGSSGSGKRNELRSCELTFAKN